MALIVCLLPPADGAHVIIVVDTNVLLSHLTFTERSMERLAAGAPSLEVQLLVRLCLRGTQNKLLS